MSDTPPEELAAQVATTAEHERLTPFAGTFRAEVRLWMGPGEPSVLTGTMVNRFELGGRFLAQSYEGDETEGPLPAFAGRGYWGFNNVTGRYEGFWIDTASTMMQTESGEVDDTGRVWTMVGEVANPGGGEPIRRRSVITLVDEDHHTMEQFLLTPEGESKTMEISYTRVP